MKFYTPQIHLKMTKRMTEAREVQQSFEKVQLHKIVFVLQDNT